MSSSYHLETDGQTEVVNRCLEAYLRCFAGTTQRLVILGFVGRIMVQSHIPYTTGVTPFEAVYGKKPPTVIHFLHGETHVEAVAAELVDWDEALRQLKTHLLKAQELMKSYADKRRRESTFEVRVFLKLERGIDL